MKEEEQNLKCHIDNIYDSLLKLEKRIENLERTIRIMNKVIE